MALSKQDLRAHLHPSEKSRFLLTLVVLIPVAIAIFAILALSLGLLLIYVGLVYFFVWVGVRTIMASYMCNTVKASPESFPEVYKAVQDAKDLFGYDKEIEAYVFEEGTYNSAILPLLRRKYILIHSEVLVDDAGEAKMRYIVGRFVGALAVKHYRFSWLQVLIDSVEKIAIFNLFLFPYERATQYSGDQLGLAMIDGDTETGVDALVSLVVGPNIAHRVNVKEFVGQAVSHRGSFFAWLARALSRFPHSANRVENLLRFGKIVYPQQTDQIIAKWR